MSHTLGCEILSGNIIVRLKILLSLGKKWERGEESTSKRTRKDYKKIGNKDRGERDPYQVLIEYVSKGDNVPGNLSSSLAPLPPTPNRVR